MRTARTAFNPCEFNELLYMCGAGSYMIDAFDPVSWVFMPIQARLVDDSSCLLIVDNSQLVVISEEYFTRWSVGPGSELLKKSEVKHAVWILEHNQAPVVDEESGLIYFGVAGFVNSFKANGSQYEEVLAP
jgi:hypothetical protein